MTTAITVATKFGPMLMPPFDAYLSRSMIVYGEYCPDEFDTWAPYLPEGGVVVDVGANFGPHTFAFATQVGPHGAVLAFEPQRMLYHMLCGTIAMSGAVHVHPKLCAIGRAPGTLLVPPTDYSAAANFGALELGNQTEGEPVPVLALAQLGLPRLDFLKVDVEGMEIDVLEGARATIERCRPVMSVEADREPQVPALLAFLREARYRVWWHKPYLGDLWPNIVSINLFALPEDRELPAPEGDVAPVESSP